MSIRKAQDDVKQWRLHVGLSNGVIPERPTVDQELLHRRLIYEETREVQDALDAAALWRRKRPEPFLAEIAKELADTIFVCLGCASDLGIDMDEVWDAVVESNMTKSGGRDYHGKIIKGDNYVAPDIESIIRRQMRGAEV